MIAYFQAHFDDDIVMELSQQWRKESKSHENNTESDFEIKEK